MRSRRRSRPAASTEPGMTTTHVYRGYVFIIRYREEDPWYTVRFPDIPQIITSGPTLAKAFANACEALDLCLETLQELGRPLPTAQHQLVVTTQRAKV